MLESEVMSFSQTIPSIEKKNEREKSSKAMLLLWSLPLFVRFFGLSSTFVPLNKVFWLPSSGLVFLLVLSYRVIAMISVNIVPSWDIEGCEPAARAFVLFAVYQNVKTLFSKVFRNKVPVYV